MQGLNAEDLQRMFTRDTLEAYQFFSRHIDFGDTATLPWHRRFIRRAQLFFVAFTMKLSPARRVLYVGSLLLALIGLFRLADRTGLPDGTQAIVAAFVLLNLLVLLEVADRLSLKNDLEIARDIQLAMLPHGLHRTQTVETVGVSRPANTVGGDFFDVIPLADGRLVVALGDVAGKGSPAALLMALLVAMLRTLVETVDELPRDVAALAARLNAQVSRHAPGNRFITLFVAFYDPSTSVLEYVNAGHTPPILLRADGSHDRLLTGGVALGMFAGSTFTADRTAIGADDLLAMYSDGISEAESPAGVPFDEDGLLRTIRSGSRSDLQGLVSAVVQAVGSHHGDNRFADDLTLLLLRRIQ
jgi:phosphoserine phosphatase RsbU/P